MAPSSKPSSSLIHVLVGATLSLALLACVPPAAAPDATTMAAPAQPMEVAVAPPTASTAPADERPSAHDACAKTTPTPRPPEYFEPIGVASCDDYIRVWNDCYRDPSARAAAQPGIDAMTKAWRDAADMGGAARDALSTGCQQALDTFPRDACR